MVFGINKGAGEESSIFSPFTVAFLSNGLNMTGLVYYFYLMFRGYGILPFVRKPQKLLMPVPLIAMGLLALTVMKINSWNFLLKFTVI